MPVKNATKSKVQKTNKAPRQSVLSVEVHDLKGAVIRRMTLPKEIFGEKINEPLMTQAVLIYLANQRAGSASTQGRGEVTGSTRKIYRQKGTGRARHGAITAPIFVGGGVAHGPRPHTVSQRLSQRMREKALLSALSAKQQEHLVKVVAGLSKVSLKTKEMAKSFARLGITGSLLLVIPQSSEMERAKKSSRNITGVSVLPPHSLNTYDVLRNKTILFAEEAIELFENHFLKKEANK